jgi:UDP-N-acetylglucosamine 1-carboxyvinyltransferase
MKDKFKIKGLNGKKTLSGKIRVNGAKNAILKVMASSVLFTDGFKMSNIPDIEDIKRMGELLNFLGANIKKIKDKEYIIDSSKIKETDLDREISEKMRGSIVLTGPLLARFGEVSFPVPGGCVIGARPIDFFVEGFEKMGAETEFKNNRYYIKTKKGKLKGALIFFKTPSVTATETFMMAGVLAEGKTVLKNVALEPEIKNLADFLISCGAKIKGAGTSTIEIQGGKLLRGKNKIYKAMPDRIETGSFLILGALCADNLEITHCNPEDIELLIYILKESGVPIEINKDTIKIKGNAKIKNKDFKSFNIKTKEYPGFPTDLQAPMVMFLTQATGDSLVFETIFEGRLNFVEDINRMGANILLMDPHRALIKGPTSLRGREVESPDLRGGLAFIIGGILAKGESIIDNVYLIDRGYERIEERLRDIGADIERISD